jgi:hypothetical protein
MLYQSELSGETEPIRGRKGRKEGRKAGRKEGRKGINRLLIDDG